MEGRGPTIITDPCRLGRHAWTDWRTVVSGTRTAEGEKRPQSAKQFRMCRRCGKSQRRAVAL